MSSMSFAFLRDRDLAWLDDAAANWRSHAAGIGDAGGDMSTAVAGAITNSAWRGGAATAAGEACDELVSLLETRRARAAGIAGALDAGYTGIEAAQARLRGLIREAEGKRLAVDDSGGVTAKADATAEAKAEVPDYADLLAACLTEARTADDETARAVADLVPERPGYLAPDEYRDLGGDLTEAIGVGPPPVDGSPQHNADWWDSLSADEQLAYTYGFPAAIGGMLGLPAAVRHPANLVLLREDAANGHDRGNAAKLLDRVEKSQYDAEHQRIYLLGYEPPGPGGAPDARIVASLGNPDTAEHTGVFVPGTGAGLGDFGGSLDRMGDLQAQAMTVPGSDDVAMVVWLGYDAPDDIAHAVLPEYADDAAPDLRGFTEGLRASHEGPASHTTVIGHSYGSTVVGTADALDGAGLAADDIIVAGSPGMGNEAVERQGWFDGPKIDDVSDMHIDEDHFWAGAGADDIISYTQVHGNAPHDWSFGGQRFSTDGASGHSEYWNNGTEALENQAYILVGEYDRVETVGRRFG